jgi:phosphate transport system substrate-binding protein
LLSRWLLISFVYSLTAFFILNQFSPAQTANKLSQVRTLYVDSLGQSKSAIELRSRLVRRLEKSHRIRIVDSVSAADAVAKGTGQIWTTGVIALGTRSHSPTEPTLEGFLSVEIVGREGQTLWSYLVTPSKFPWGGIADDLARQIVTRLVSDINEDGRRQNASSSETTENARASLNGAGATFPAPLYRKWFELFKEDHPNVQIAYDAVGSGEGIRRLKEGKTDFGASEMPLPDEDVSGDHPHFMQLPMVLGAVVPIYNLKNVHQDINFSGEALAGIYLGKIKKWNDPQIRAVNRGVTLPDAEIIVVHRSDASGTSFVWSDYLSKVSSEWRASVGSGTTLAWPVGLGSSYNEGVAATIEHTPNAIGYVEFIYALQHELRFGAVRNAAGEFVRADIASVRAASANSGQPDRGFRISIADAPGKASYPIATYTWLLLPRQEEDKNKSTVLRELARWMLTSGQKSCSALGYVPLPESTAMRALQALEPQIESAGSK